MPVPGCFDYSGLVIEFYIRYCDPSYIVLSQNCCGYLGSFIIPYNFLNVCSIYVKYAIGSLTGIVLNLKLLWPETYERMLNITSHQRDEN